jgi:MFS family permease
VFGVSVLTLPALPAMFGYIALIAGCVAIVAYFWWAKHTPYPILDFRLFRFPLFRTTNIAGTFFRLGTGAMPFLFPLMLQLGFGLSPFQSGMITFATAVGAFAAKFVAEPILHRLGFRWSLVSGTLIAVLGVAAMGFYSPATPLPLMLTVLVIMGFFMSIFWTGTNAFTFADIEDKDAGQATAINQVGIQLSLAFGVALGGGVLEGLRLLHGGGTPQLGDFHIAFFVIASVALVSTVMFLFLPKEAGKHLTGHRSQAVEAAE